MKKLSLILLIATALLLFSCGSSVPEDKKTVVITAKNVSVGENLLSYMERTGVKFTTQSKDFVVSINGTAAGLAEYWLLFTDDPEFGTESYGTLDHDGKTYLSAIVGITDLIIKEGKTYVWNLQKF